MAVSVEGKFALILVDNETVPSILYVGGTVQLQDWLWIYAKHASMCDLDWNRQRSWSKQKIC